LIIPCYNQAHFLYEAIQSALAQTYSHREILVVDNRMRARGADYLLLPATAFWWLDHYQKFREHLEARYPTVVR
jgi:cellulose synthase/poly-beta-1,6-N-acetylglucosamine synthase-like glycosyltransferase